MKVIRLIGSYLQLGPLATFLLLTLCGCKNDPIKQIPKSNPKAFIEPKELPEAMSTEISALEYSLAFKPEGPAAFSQIPSYVVKDFKRLKTEDSIAYVQHLTLLFSKVYAEHLRCCHQGYVINTSNDSTNMQTQLGNQIIAEFLSMIGHPKPDKESEFLTSAIAVSWFEENPKPLSHEPIMREYQQILRVQDSIKKGLYWK